MTTSRILLLALLVLLCPAPGAAGADLPVACTVPNAALADVRVPFDLALERSAEAVLIRFDATGDAHTHLLLRMPGCAVVPLAGGPVPPGEQPLAVRPGGARLIAATRAADGRPQWWYSPAPDTPLVAVDAPTDARVAGQPILSDDGAWAAWVDLRPGTGEQFWHARRLLGDEVRGGSLSGIGPGSYEMLGYDQKRSAMTLARNLAEIVDVATMAAGIVGAPLRLGEGIASQPRTFRRLGSGWFAWDAYRTDTPWRAIWSIEGRTGRYDVDWGKAIVHAAVAPSGAYAALRLESRFNRLFATGDTLVLVRLADGREILRRSLPRFTHTPVAFLGDQYLAWSEGGQVLVARLP
jgi:hypothetical protein